MESNRAELHGAGESAAGPPGAGRMGSGLYARGWAHMAARQSGATRSGGAAICIAPDK